MGVVMALMERRLLPRVVSGTSGGSIIAGIMAVKTDKELLEDVFVPDIAVRYKERWFPPISTQLHHFFNEGVLIDNAEFKRCARRYFGTLTFEEAFERTGRNVAISVSPSRVGGGSGTRHTKLLLNHITNPHVLVASAVQASCALPGIMNPVELECKDADGNIVPYLMGGIEWVDGSITADIPTKRLRELFNTNSFIVSQVNPVGLVLLIF